MLRNTRPDPPRMPRALDELKTRELFWVVRQGLRYSGMRGWPHPGRISLEAYAEDRRHAGIMGPMAKLLEAAPPRRTCSTGAGRSPATACRRRTSRPT